MRRLISDLKYLLVCYRWASLWTRLHICGRRILCPLDKLVREIPIEGIHLDVGCGHGILLALIRRRCPQKTLIGIDISAEKVDQARLVENANTTFHVRRVEQFPPCSVDSISLVDVLYLVPEAEREHLFKACASALRPGGKFLVKETGRKPFWKYLILLLQEFLAVRVLGITQGAVIRVASEQDISQLLLQTGLISPDIRHLDQGYPYPHVCFTTQKPDRSFNARSDLCNA